MTLEEYINKKQANSEEKKVDFVTYLYKLMYEKGFDNPSIVYKRAHITKQLWSAITTKKCNPSLKSCLKLRLL